MSCSELRMRASIVTAMLLSTTAGCGFISDAPHRSMSMSAVLGAESLSDNPRMGEPQTDIPSLQSSSAAIIPHSPENQEPSPAPTLPTVTSSTVIGTGLASWYGARHHGKRTASGEIFDQNKFTAAHRTLPWRSIVKVTNLDNGKSVEVRINDRGPFTKGRIIDLSRAAAKALGMLELGVSPVRMELLSPGEISTDLVSQNSRSPSTDSNYTAFLEIFDCSGIANSTLATEAFATCSSLRSMLFGHRIPAYLRKDRVAAVLSTVTKDGSRNSRQAAILEYESSAFR